MGVMKPCVVWMLVPMLYFEVVLISGPMVFWVSTGGSVWLFQVHERLQVLRMKELTAGPSNFSILELLKHVMDEEPEGPSVAIGYVRP